MKNSELCYLKSLDNYNLSELKSIINVNRQHKVDKI